MTKSLSCSLFTVMALCLVCAPGIPEARAGADEDYQTALTYLDDTSNLHVDSALIYLHSALASSPSHGAANVFAAVLEFAQMVDDRALVAYRKSFSNNADSASLSEYLSRLIGREEHFDSMVDYRDYSWGSDPVASDVQSILNHILADSIPHIESHILTAIQTSAVFDFPKNLIEEGKRSDTFEIDKTELYALHSGLLAIKALLVILTSYDLDVRDTLDRIPDTVSWDDFRDSYPNLLGGKGDWDTAWAALQQIDTNLYEGLTYLNSESDSQDSDFIRRISNADTDNDRYINDTHLSDALDWHSDTLQRLIYKGDSLAGDPDDGNEELDSFYFVPSALFAAPPDRTDFGGLRLGPRGRGLEWNDEAWIDPTFGGIFPRMTLDNLFLHAFHPDTFFIISSEQQTIDINSLFPYWNWTPEIIDLRFDAAAPVTLIRRNSYYDTRLWKIDITPKTTGFHVRLLFDRFDDEDFFPWETYKIHRFGDFSGPTLRVVPWSASGGQASDAGSSASAFDAKFTSFKVANSWLTYGADTLQMYAMRNGKAFFDTIASSTIIPSSNDTTLVSGAATELGWFIPGAPATPSDSVQIVANYTWLTGDTGSPLSSDFVVKVSKRKIFTDTRYGFFTDTNTDVPLSGETVTFSVVDYPSGATGFDLDTESAVTNSSGYAYTRLTLGNKPGVYVVKASLVAASGGADALMFGATAGIAYWYGVAAKTGPWFIFSLPRTPSSLVPSSVIESRTFSSGDWKMYEYNTSAGAYEVPAALELGAAYWLKTLDEGLIDLSAASSLSTTQYIPLAAGWNMVGIPFEQAYSTRNLFVQTAAGNTVSIDTAIDSGILERYFHSWDGSTYDKCPDETFDRSGCYFYPYEGQWVYAAQACTLVAPPVSTAAFTGPRITSATYRAPNFSAGKGRSAKLLSSAPLAPKKSDDWTVQLIARSGSYSDMSNAIGVRPTSVEPIRKAPKPPAGVHLAIRSAGTGYSSLFASPADPREWEFDVTSTSAGVVHVSAANIESVPDDVPLTLMDQSTGHKVDLRQSASYSYFSGAAESRSFLLSTGGFSVLDKLAYPAACVVRRAVGFDGAVTELLRRWRDGWLANSFGRRLTRTYYGWFGSPLP